MRRTTTLAFLSLVAACTEKPKDPPPPPSRFTEVTHLDPSVSAVKGYALEDGIAFAKKSEENDAGKGEGVAVMVDGIDVRTGLSDFPETVAGKRGAVFVVGNRQTRLVPPGFVWDSLDGLGQITPDHWIGYLPHERRWDKDNVAVSLRGKGPLPEPPEKYGVTDAALNADGQMCAVLKRSPEGGELGASTWSAWSMTKEGKEQVVALADKLETAPQATRSGAECVIVSTDVAEGQRHVVLRRFTEQGLVRLHDLPIPERFPYALSKDGHFWYLGTTPGSPELPELHHVVLDLKSARPSDDRWPLPATIPGCANAHPRSIIPSRGEDVWLELECAAPKHVSLLHARAQSPAQATSAAPPRSH